MDNELRLILNQTLNAHKISHILSYAVCIVSKIFNYCWWLFIEEIYKCLASMTANNPMKTLIIELI